MSTLPPIFVSHGSPMTALEPGPTGDVWRRLGPALTARFGRPRAVLALSAHSLARQPVLLAGRQHHAVYDFSGFPAPLYRLRYDAPGAPALAQQVAALLAAAGRPAQCVDQGGLDHGIWTPLRFFFPDADVPVLPLAFSPTDTPAAQWALGRALAPLAAEGVWILGSGSLTHNLGLLAGSATRPPPDAPEMPKCAAFREWVHRRGAARDWDALLDYRRQAPHADLMHPSDEHWLPFYVAAGAGGDAAPARRLHAAVTYGCLAMDLYAFGTGAAALETALGVGDRLPA
jgi:4,5-DOPA dioxygenase extradiol